MDNEHSTIILEMEKILRDPSASPIPLPLYFLKAITKNFCDNQKIGSGSFGDVYKGVLPNHQKIAVKRLRPEHLWNMDDKKFKDEVTCFKGMAHKNVVRLLGYCAETHKEFMEYEGNNVLVDHPQRLICFEYMDKGSLRDIIADKYSGLEWNKRYRIIIETCEGLKYLHEEKGIVHLDLKPENILLDRDLVPKISDFGISRLFGNEQTTKITTTFCGTIGYMPPEHIDQRKITLAFDIYSLGVIMQEIITGERMNESSDSIIENWKKRLQATLSHSSLEATCRQISICLDIALRCQKHRTERPTIGEIINMLKETEIGCQEKDIVASEKGKDTIAACTSTKLLDIQPQELRFPFEPNKLNPCPLHITNTTDHRIAFRFQPWNPNRYFTKWLCGVVPPGSRYQLTVTMKEHLKPQNPDEFLMEQSSLDGDRLMYIETGKAESEFDIFFKSKALDEVHKQTLVAVCDPQVQKTCEVIPKPKTDQIVSMDVHPTRPWILTGHTGHIYIWDYKTKEKVKSFVHDKIKDEVLTVKFIPRKDWFVAGGAGGYIFVYCYTTDKLVKSFQSLKERITSLAIHPTEPYLLSASYNFKIGKWNWNSNSTQTFNEKHSGSVTQVVFNSKDTRFFASASKDQSVKIWSFDSPKSMLTLTGHTSIVRCLEFFTDSEKQYLIAGYDDGFAMIWDTENCTSVKTLKGHANRVAAVCYHPDRSVLMTGSYDGSVCIWNSQTFRLERTLNFGLSRVCALACVKGSSRVVIGHRFGLVITEIGA